MERFSSASLPSLLTPWLITGFHAFTLAGLARVENLHLEQRITAQSHLSIAEGGADSNEPHRQGSEEVEVEPNHDVVKCAVDSAM